MSRNKAEGDLMFLGMQDFDFAKTN